MIETAYRFAAEILPDYSSRFSRHDFTLAQLFACLVLREWMDLSYRRTEAMLVDSPEWYRLIGMQKAPDHNTLCRAFKRILTHSNCHCLLDLINAHMQAYVVVDRVLAVDATMLESSHVSPHFERRKRDTLSEAERILRHKKKLQTLPKLTIVVGVGSHLITAARTSLGIGNDHGHFGPILDQARRRCRRATHILADAGYDSEKAHRYATKRQFNAIIPPLIGKQTGTPPKTPRRRRMHRDWQSKYKLRYRQRGQVERPTA